MSLNLEETLKRLTDFLQTEAKTETVVGKTSSWVNLPAFPSSNSDWVWVPEVAKAPAEWMEKQKVKELAEAGVRRRKLLVK